MERPPKTHSSSQEGAGGQRARSGLHKARSGLQQHRKPPSLCQRSSTHSQLSKDTTCDVGLSVQRAESVQEEDSGEGCQEDIPLRLERSSADQPHCAQPRCGQPGELFSREQLSVVACLAE